MTLSSTLLTFTLLASPAGPSDTAPTQDDPPAGEVDGEAAEGPAPTKRFGGYVEAGWRVLGLGGHLSHGPSFAAAAILWHHLEIGVAGFARPGPINPRTFAVELPDGQTYKGQSTLNLRSDGSVIGLMVGPRFDFRRAPISLALPVLVGYGGFGFYLHGEDRDTPDGRRVSEWENELLDGRDSDPVNLVLDFGLRLAWTPRSQPHVRPFLSANYTFVTGFDTAVLSSYSGFSGALGIQFGVFPRR